MNQSIAYRQAAEILKPIENIVPPNKGQWVADNIVRALISAYIKGRKSKEK